jgi:hypothetical protein
MHCAPKVSVISCQDQSNPSLVSCVELFARALKCDPNHAETLLNYANFLDANDEHEQGDEHGQGRLLLTYICHTCNIYVHVCVSVCTFNAENSP